MVWERIKIEGRKDVIGVRTLVSGKRQFLMHNAALCQPYYTATCLA